MAEGVIKSDSVTEDITKGEAVTSKSLAGIIESAARKKISTDPTCKNKTTCDVIGDLPEFKNALSYLPVYVPGASQPFKLSRLAFNQLKGKLDSTVDIITREWNNTLVSNYKLTNLENISSDLIRSGGTAYSKSSKQLVLPEENVSVQLQPFNYQLNQTVSGYLNTTRKTITIENVKMYYRINNGELIDYYKSGFTFGDSPIDDCMCSWGLVTLSDLTVNYGALTQPTTSLSVDTDEALTDLAQNNSYSARMLTLEAPLAGEYTFTPIKHSTTTLATNFVAAYSKLHGIDLNDGKVNVSKISLLDTSTGTDPESQSYSIESSVFDLSLPVKHTDISTAMEQKNSTELSIFGVTVIHSNKYWDYLPGDTQENSNLTFNVDKIYYIDANNTQISGNYDISFTADFLNYLMEYCVLTPGGGGGISPEHQSYWPFFNVRARVKFAAVDNAYEYSESSDKNLASKSVGTTLNIRDDRFTGFILSLKGLYKFFGSAYPPILNTLYPSFINESGELSYNQTTETISNLKLHKSKNPADTGLLTAAGPSGLTTNAQTEAAITAISYSFSSTSGSDTRLAREEASKKTTNALYIGLYNFYNTCRETFFKSFKGVLTVDDTSIKSEVSKADVIKHFNCDDNYKSKLASLDMDSPEYTAAYTAYEEAYNLEHPEVAQEKKQKAAADAEKMEKLSQARNKVDTLQYQTVMQNPATTFSSRMEQLDVTGSYDVNKMEHNEYEYEGTLCIKEKIDSPASIRIYSENKESAGPARTIESIYVDCFLLQGVQEVDEEKYSIFQSLNGDTLVQFFGRRPTTLNLSGILYDTKNQQWYNDFKYWYDNYLRGSAALKNDSRIVLVYTDQIIEGFILSMSMQKQSTMNVSVTVNFTMLVVSHTQLATEWTDPEHSEHIRGDRHCGHMIDEAYAEHEKNKAKLDSLSGLNFELLADASPDKGNYYDNYLKSNTKLGSALEYSSGSSLSSIAFSSKLADVKLNMDVSEVSSDVIATANSNQNAGLAIGSSGISVDSLKLKLNNAEDFARSYRTSQEKSIMDQINFRLSKS